MHARSWLMYSSTSCWHIKPPCPQIRPIFIYLLHHLRFSPLFMGFSFALQSQMDSLGPPFLTRSRDWRAFIIAFLLRRVLYPSCALKIPPPLAETEISGINAGPFPTRDPRWVGAILVVFIAMTMMNWYGRGKARIVRDDVFKGETMAVDDD